MSDFLHLPRRVRKAAAPIKAGPIADPAATKPAGKKPEAAPRRPRFARSDGRALRIRAVHAASADHLAEQAGRGALDAVEALRAPRLTAAVERKLARKDQHLIFSPHAPMLMAAPNHALPEGRLPIKQVRRGQWAVTAQGQSDQKHIVRRLLFGLFDLRRKASAGVSPLPRSDLARLLKQLQDSPSAWLSTVTEQPELLPRMAASLERVEAVAVVISTVKAPLLVPTV